MTGPALLRAWRDEHGVTQTQFAERLGVAQSRISVWESTDGPTPELRFAVAIERETSGAVPCESWVD